LTTFINLEVDLSIAEEGDMLRTDQEHAKCRQQRAGWFRLGRVVADVIKSFQLENTDDLMKMIQDRLEHLTSEIRQYEFPWKERDAECPFETLGHFEKLADALIAARLRMGLSQAEFARIVNVLPQQLSRYEKTRYKTITMERAIALVRCVRAYRDRR
jgi:hypothetical protein